MAKFVLPLAVIDCRPGEKPLGKSVGSLTFPALVADMMAGTAVSVST